jgi:hypothetical protein
MKIILLLMLITLSSYSQDDSIIKLFPGKWKMNVEGAVIFEEWKKVSETEFTGMSYSLNGGEKNISENLCLKRFANQWAYVAVPKNQTITLFALVEHTTNKFIFENNEHDFPQRIIYEFKYKDELTATVEGIVDGKLEQEKFHFTRIVK